MDIVGPFVNVIDTYLVAPLVRQINYLRSSGANFNDMQTVVRKLMARKDDKERSLKGEENEGRVQTKEASNWFEEVEAIKTKADAIQEEYHQGTCAGGWCVNCWSRYKLSKRSVDLKQKAQGRFDEQFDLTRRASLKPVREIESEPLIENQPSTQRMLQKIIGYIGVPRFGVIGVYGMGGVGKTTLAKEVNNHFSKLENSPFDTVTMVTVSATPNIPSIRTSIGKRIGLDLSNDSEDDARGKLFDALKKKKFLLILDDVWENSKLKLEDVGIPDPKRNNKNGSKILLTSRSQDACTDMGAKITKKVEPLLEDESWNLFVDKVGDRFTAADDRIKCSAEKIVEKCKGLPLAIVTVARAMANRHRVGEWEDAAREMERSASNPRGMKEDVFVPLKFSFDRLENDMLRSLFLFCACFPEDHNIEEDDILDYCIGERLLIHGLDSLTAVRNKGETLIGSLKIACMLEDGEYEGSMRMHDMMRQLALWIISSESDGSPKFLIRTGDSFKEAPQANEWVDATRISMMHTEIEELPKLGERCSKLTTLLLRKNTILETIPPTKFFQPMHNLSLLDLSYSVTLKYLPDSLSCLVNLRVLRLKGCRNLRAIPALRMLRQLQILDLGHCEMLNQQIIGSDCVGGISDVRYLDVSYSGVSIPVGVISRSFKLEELKLYSAKNIRWRVINSENEKWDESDSHSDGSKGQREEEEEEDHQHQPIEIDVRELSQLTHLTSLSINFQGINISNWFITLAKKIRKLKLDRCTGIQQYARQLLDESQILEWLVIRSCQGVTCVPTHVKSYLWIYNCEDLEVLDEAEEAYQDSFQSLQELFLYELPKLERIFVGVEPLNCFGQLRVINIIGCNRMKMVFTKGMPRLFNNLGMILVENCKRMEVIIEAEKEEDVVISPFPKLRSLYLNNLSAIAEVCDNHILRCPLLRHVVVDNCPMLKKNPLRIRNEDGLLVVEDGKTTWEGEVMEEEEIQQQEIY